MGIDNNLLQQVKQALHSIKKAGEPTGPSAMDRAIEQSKKIRAADPKNQLVGQPATYANSKSEYMPTYKQGPYDPIWKTMDNAVKIRFSNNPSSDIGTRLISKSLNNPVAPMLGHIQNISRFGASEALRRKYNNQFDARNIKSLGRPALHEGVSIGATLLP